MEAFAGNDAFQKAEPRAATSGPRSFTLKDRLEAGQAVQPAHLGRKQINQAEQ